MNFGVVLQTDPPARQVIELAQLSESLGFGYVWTFDSPVLWQEPFVIYSGILANTKSVIVGPMVTNPLSRHWAVTASLFATLNDMYGNRTICGIGRGDSAVRVIGRTPASLATLDAAMGVIKDLAEGRPARLGDTPVTIPWVHDGRLDIWMAAYGPRALELAGQRADGLILQIADPFIVRWAVGVAREAATAVGRDPAELQDLCGRPRLRRGRPAQPAGPAALVRRDGGQPCRGHSGALRLQFRRRARGAELLYRGPQGLRLQPPRQAWEPDD